MLPNTGIDIAPDTERCVPEMTICATLVAVGSLTARLPEIVAKGESALMPVQLWQLAQACSNTLRPSASGTAPPSLGDSGAARAIVAGSGDTTAGMLRAQISHERPDIRRLHLVKAVIDRFAHRPGRRAAAR